MGDKTDLHGQRGSLLQIVGLRLRVEAQDLLRECLV